MDIPNAFIGKKEQPTDNEVRVALGPCAETWDRFVAWMAEKNGVSDQEWNSSGAKYGWALRLKLKKRNIVYLGPCNGCFRISFVLGGRAVEAARQGDAPKAMIELLDAAPKYPEGTGVRLMVKTEKDLAMARRFADLKLRF